MNVNICSGLSYQERISAQSLQAQKERIKRGQEFKKTSAQCKIPSLQLDTCLLFRSLKQGRETSDIYMSLYLPNDTGTTWLFGLLETERHQVSIQLAMMMCKEGHAAPMLCLSARPKDVGWVSHNRLMLNQSPKSQCFSLTH